MTSTALAIARAYYDAWTAKDFDHAMTYLADNLVCDAPAGRLVGAAEFRAFMQPFTQIVTQTELLAAFGDEDTAVLVYDTDTVPVSGAPGAERLTIRAGKIVHIRIIFDRLPFETARRAAPPPREEGELFTDASVAAAGSGRRTWTGPAGFVAIELATLVR